MDRPTRRRRERWQKTIIALLAAALMFAILVLLICGGGLAVQTSVQNVLGFVTTTAQYVRLPRLGFNQPKTDLS